MRATEILSRAKEEILAFATSQAEQIKDWNIQIGAWKKTGWEHYYSIDPREYGYHWKIKVEISVYNTCSLDFSTEIRKVEEIRLYDDGIALALENENEPVYLRSLSVSEIAKISDVLEEIFMGLMHSKKSN